MKSNVIKGVGCIVAACAVLYACQKDLSPSLNAAKPSLSASSTNVSAGEQVALKVNNNQPGTHVVWSSNAGQASFSSTGQGTANVSFSKPGTYTVSAFIVSGSAQDSVPVLYHQTYDTTGYPHDTVPYNPYDTVPHNPYDTIPHNPYDTVPHSPYDTVPHNPYDTVPNYPHDTTPHIPIYDTIYYYPDSTYIDSVTRAHNGQVITVVTIVIVVH